MFAESQQKEMETRYRILFESNPAPTMLLNSCDVVAFANPAAFKVLGNDIIGVQVEALIEFIEHEDGDHHDDLIAKIFDDDFDREFRVVMTKLTEIEFPQTRNFSFALGEISAVNNAVTQITMFDVTPQTRLAKVSHDYAVSLIKVQEEERKRIALELHDDTIQKLINISQKLQLATYDSADEMKLQLNDLYDTTVNTIGDLRRIATGLRPSILDDFGFAVALKIWIAELVDADKIKLNIVGKPLRLNSDAELNLFRVVQEAISNSVKHSGANNLFVEVSFSPELVRICIKDDGIGFDSKKIHFGMGVLGMEERIKMLNGKFKISSLLDQGTLIEVMVDVTDKLKA
jgi:signal transduction histidine kinase